MINKLKLEIKVALFTLQQIFGTEHIISGSVADFINICDMSIYFEPNDLDIVLTPNQLKTLKRYFFVREVEGLYNDNVVVECFTNIGGCNIDIFVKDDFKDEESDVFKFGDWNFKKTSIKARLKQHHKAIKSKNISNYRKRKHQNRLTFYKIRFKK